MSSEQFRIVYYDVGQGDCILIVCPDDKLVMIDCGSSKGMISAEKDGIAAEIRGYTKKNKGKLDALILTHPDKDHYNQVIELLSERSYQQDEEQIDLGLVTIDHVYFSEKLKNTGYVPMYSYNKEAAVGSTIRNQHFKTQYLTHIIITAKENEQKRRIYTQKDGFKKVKEEPINNYRHTILHGWTKKNKEWQISIIAGSVSGHDGTNPMSLVTLLEIGPSKEHKALFLGDATFETEKFLMDTHRQLIKNVQFSHVPHHGSDTSSGEAFVKTVNPRAAQVTMQTAETNFCLPKKVQVMRWLEQVSDVPASLQHLIDYWEVTEGTKVTAELASWENNISYEGHMRTSGQKNNKHYLQIDNINPQPFTGYYYLQHERMLRRDKTKKDLWMTGVSGLTEWFLPFK